MSRRACSNCVRLITSFAVTSSNRICAWLLLFVIVLATRCKEVSLTRQASLELRNERLEAMMELISWHIESKHRHEHLGEGYRGFMKDRTWEGNSHIGVKTAQVLDYFQEVEKYAAGRPTLICEVGLNGGHSAAAFLLAAGKNSRYVSFDIGNFGPVTYYNTTVVMLQRVFPGQIDFILGDSAVTVPNFASTRGRICDIISVDGDHSKEGALRDLTSIQSIAKRGALVLMDDVNLEGPRHALEHALSSGTLSKIRCVHEKILRIPREHRRSQGATRIMKQGWCFLRVRR